MESGLQKLSIREKEDAEFVISSEDIQREEINFELCLLGKLIGERTVNAEAFERTMLSLWRPMRGAYIKPMGENNLYIIQFYHQVDLKRMLAGGPWSFNKCIMLVHQWKEGEDPVNIDFTHTDVWAQFHGLPLGFASEALARNIGNLMGTYLEYDSANHRSSWNSYMRVRVRLNVEEPLMSKKNIRKQGANPIEITFSYERLPLVCYLCGIIGHSETNCLKLLERPEEEHCRKWPEEIKAEVRARNAQKLVQWKRDPGNDSGVDFATNSAPRFFPSTAQNPHRIGNSFSYYPKKILSTSPAIPRPHVGHIPPDFSGDQRELSGFNAFPIEKESSITIIEECKKRPRQGSTSIIVVEEMDIDYQMQSNPPNLSPAVGLAQQTR